MMRTLLLQAPLFDGFDRGLDEKHAELIDANGVQIAPLHYPHPVSYTHLDVYKRQAR